MANLILPNVPGRYEADTERARNDVLERADRDNVKRWDVAGLLSRGSPNLDGGVPDSNYGGITALDGGGV